MKKFLPLLSALLVGASLHAADYTTGQEDKTTNHGSRKTSALAITDNVGSTTLNLSPLQTASSGQAIYWDKSSQTFTTKQGAAVTVTPTSAWNWMQNAVYLDWDSDGFLYTDDDDYIDATTHAIKADSDLVAACGYNYKGLGTWYNPDGTNHSGGNYGNLGALTFNIPATAVPGSYRVRYKVDWACLDPKGNPGDDGSNSGNNWIGKNGGIIVDFTLVIEEDVTPADPELVAAAINGATNAVNGWSNILPSDKLSNLQTRIAALPRASEVTTEPQYNELHTACSAIIDEAYGNVNGKVITLKKDGKYFTATSAAAAHMADYVTEAGKWTIVRNGAENSFRLKNVKYHSDIVNDNTLVAHGNTNVGAGTAFEITAYAGWTMAHAAVTVDALDTTGATYYRIRSARALWGTNAQSTRNSLVGTNTAVSNGIAPGADSPLLCRADGLGALWTLEATDQGKVFIRNAAADFEGQDKCFAIGSTTPTAKNHNNDVISGQNAVAVDIFAADGAPGSSFAQHYPQALCIRTLESGTSSNYLDDNGSNAPVFNGWDQVDNNFPNNGGIYYFEPVDPADAQNIIDEYIAAVNTEEKIAAKRAEIETWKGFPALVEADDVDAVIQAWQTPEPASVKEANSMGGACANLKSNIALVNALFAKADGRLVQFCNEGYADSDARHGRYIANPASQATGRMVGVESPHSPSAIWRLHHVNGLTFKLQNYRSGLYMGEPAGGASANQIPAAEGAPVTIELYASQSTTGNDITTLHTNVVSLRGANGHRFHMGNTSADDYRLIQYDSQTDGATLWKMTSFDDISAEVQVNLEAEDEGYILSFTHADYATVGTHDADEYHADHKITVNVSATVQAPAAGAPRRVIADGNNDFTHSQVQEGAIALDGDLRGKTVVVSVPAGFFKLTSESGDTALSKAINASFSVGEATGIEEIGVEDVPAAIYDLRGRRVANPVRGLYIVNGRKVIL